MTLTNNELIAAAAQIGCEVAAIRAVDSVESNGTGFVRSGQIVMRFETHLFAALTGKTVTGYTRASFDKAAAINRDAAIRSTSWGRYQILGSNYKACGYASPEAYLQAMLKGESEQLRAFVRLMTNWGLGQVLKRHDWAAFAQTYNGPGYAKNKYDTKLRDAYLTFSKQAFPPTNTPTPTPSFSYGTAILALICLGLLGSAAYVSYMGLWPQFWQKTKSIVTPANRLSYA